MLQHLHIQNFAIVEDLELDFGRGMTVLTGETGAGKSILLDALGLALGDRADSAAIRPGAERAEISADFGLQGLDAVGQWLREHELDADGDCLVRRTVSNDGRSRGFINGHPVTMQLLRGLGERLVEIHSQHAHQSLLRRDIQRQVLDDYAENGPLLARLADTYRQWKVLREERDRLFGDEQERESRLELLRYQVNELEALDLQAGEIPQLDEEHDRLANASRLLEGGQRAVASLYEGDGTVADLLNRNLSELRELQNFDPKLSNVVEMLEGATIQVQEAAVELRQYLSDTDLDPERLAWVEQRMGLLHDLARKHRVEPDELPAVLERLRQELTGLEHADERRGQIDRELAAIEQAYLTLAGEVQASRQGAAARLAAEVSDNIRDLGLGEGRFEITVCQRQEGDYAAHGLDNIEFLVCANPGQPLHPLNKVASGGELSRISLAIQVIVAGRRSTPTLVFDEVDVGVGGGVAEMVGRQLRRLGGHTQVLCVTHQPQVAALGHNHLRVSKNTGDGTTRAHIEALRGDARVDEIARMLGGVQMTDQTRAHAWEMLALAQEPSAQGRKEA